jgi:hypothetical protein
MLVRATLTGSPEATVLLEKTVGAGVKTGMRGQAATNPNQHQPLFESWAKSQAGALYWAVLTALLQG